MFKSEHEYTLGSAYHVHCTRTYSRAPVPDLSQHTSVDIMTPSAKEASSDFSNTAGLRGSLIHLAHYSYFQGSIQISRDGCGGEKKVSSGIPSSQELVDAASGL